MMVLCIGAAPLNFGNSDGWTFRQFEGGKRSRTFGGIARPNEAVTIRLFGLGVEKGGGGYEE